MPSNSTDLCRIVRLVSGRPVLADAVRPGDEIYLIAELPSSNSVRTLAVEILRGSERRDCWQRTIEPTAERTVLAYRLHWRDRPTASTRLSCRVQLDGRLLGCPVVLLTPGADAQGRFDSQQNGPISERTRIAFVDAFDRLLNPSRNGRVLTDNPLPPPRTSGEAS